MVDISKKKKYNRFKTLDVQNKKKNSLINKIFDVSSFFQLLTMLLKYVYIIGEAIVTSRPTNLVFILLSISRRAVKKKEKKNSFFGFKLNILSWFKKKKKEKNC